MNLKKLLSNRKKLVLVALIIIVIAVFGAKRFIGKEEQFQFITSQVERTTLVDAIQASVGIIATGQQTVTIDATGVIKSVFVDDGNVVRKGDKLAKLEPDQEGVQQSASAYSSHA